MKKNRPRPRHQPAALKPLPDNAPSAASRRKWLWLGVFAAALFVRLPLLAQSQWYDEMFWRLHYLAAGWERVLSAAPGEYAPNNHVLYTILAKALAGLLGNSAFAMRLPSALAGAGVGIALAWPLRRSAPTIALFVALVASLHPWLIAFSVEARGYALLLLLCVIATNALPSRRGQIAWGYALAMVAAIYTVPIALLLLAGHGLTMLLLRRQALWSWLTAAAAALVLAGLLYLPMLPGMRAYWGQPHAASQEYGEFLNGIAWSSLIGVSVATVPAAALAIGLVLAAIIRTGLSEQAFRPAIVSFLVTGILALWLPLAVPSAGEVRFALWFIVPVSLGLAVWLVGLAARLGRRATSPRQVNSLLLTLVLLYAAVVIWPVSQTPAQPVRDAIAEAGQLAGARPVIGVYMTSQEAAAIYGGLTTFAYRLDHLQAFTGDKPAVLVVFYERQLQRDQPELWDYIQERYQLHRRLSGRVSPVAIYEPKPMPATRP